VWPEDTEEGGIFPIILMAVRGGVIRARAAACSSMVCIRRADRGVSSPPVNSRSPRPCWRCSISAARTSAATRRGTR